jgi:hypothetical protein
MEIEAGVERNEYGATVLILRRNYFIILHFRVVE